MTSLPSHELTWKKGIVGMLKNLNKMKELLSGIRLMVSKDSLDEEIITGRTRTLLPLIDLPHFEATVFFSFKRRQFPSITVNKAQRQTIDRVGVYLAELVFSHGHLYIALSHG